MVTELSSCCRCASRRAFSLLELLLCIALIGLLVSIIAPSISGSRSRSRSLVCLSNLRQLGAGCGLYSAADPQSQILPAHPISDIDHLHFDGKFDYGGATGASAGWNGTYGPHGPRTAGTRPLNAVIYGYVSESTDFRLFRCPDDPGSTDTYEEENWWWTPDFVGRPFFVSLGTSYLGNALRQHEANGLQAAGPFKVIGVFLRPVNRVPQASETVLLNEAGLQIRRVGSVPEDYSYEPTSTTGWHASPGEQNIGFVDGHADRVRLESQFTRGSWAADHGGYAYWVRSSGIRWDCRPEPLTDDLPDDFTSGVRR